MRCYLPCLCLIAPLLLACGSGGTSNPEPGAAPLKYQIRAYGEVSDTIDSLSGTWIMVSQYNERGFESAVGFAGFTNSRATIDILDFENGSGSLRPCDPQYTSTAFQIDGNTLTFSVGNLDYELTVESNTRLSGSISGDYLSTGNLPTEADGFVEMKKLKEPNGVPLGELSTELERIGSGDSVEVIASDVYDIACFRDGNTKILSLAEDDEGDFDPGLANTSRYEIHASNFSDDIYLRLNGTGFFSLHTLTVPLNFVIFSLPVALPPIPAGSYQQYTGKTLNVLNESSVYAASGEFLPIRSVDTSTEQLRGSFSFQLPPR